MLVYIDLALKLAEVKQSVARKKLSNIFTYKARTRRQPKEGDEEDSFGNPSVQSEVTRAGYTPTQPISEELTLLTPVSRNSRRCTRYLI
jgi:hypothetical protein